MQILAESLKRLYKNGRLTREQVEERVSKGSISADEFQHITGEDIEQSKLESAFGKE